MTDVVQGFQLNIPANHTSGNPIFEHTRLGDCEVTHIQIVFPAGCSGLVGVHVNFASNTVYPIGTQDWFVFDGYIVDIDVTGQGNSGDWSVAGYNTDIFPHLVLVYFYYNYLTGSQQQSLTSLVSL